MRVVLGAGEEAEEGAAPESDMIADGTAEHGVLDFESVEDGTLGDGAGDFDLHFRAAVGEGAEMSGKSDADHFITSTDEFNTLRLVKPGENKEEEELTPRAQGKSA